MIHLNSLFEWIIVFVHLFEPFPQVIYFQLQQLYILSFQNALIHSRQFFEANTIGFESNDFINLVIEILQLFA